MPLRENSPAEETFSNPTVNTTQRTSPSGWAHRHTAMIAIAMGLSAGAALAGCSDPEGSQVAELGDLGPGTPQDADTTEDTPDTELEDTSPDMDTPDIPVKPDVPEPTDVEDAEDTEEMDLGDTPEDIAEDIPEDADTGEQGHIVIDRTDKGAFRVCYRIFLDTRERMASIEGLLASFDHIDTQFQVTPGENGSSVEIKLPESYSHFIVQTETDPNTPLYWRVIRDATCAEVILVFEGAEPLDIPEFPEESDFEDDTFIPEAEEVTTVTDPREGTDTSGRTTIRTQN